MNDSCRYNRVNIHHHLREDVVVMLPHVAYRNGTIGFGDGCVLPRIESVAIGEAILRMLENCASVDTRPLEEKRAAAMERLRLGFQLSHEEHFPSFNIPSNWGLIYERYPAILCDPRISARYFSTADVSDRAGSDLLTLDQLQLRRKDKGVYTTGDSVTFARSDGPATIGVRVSAWLQSWRLMPGFIAQLTALAGREPQSAANHPTRVSGGNRPF